MSAPTRRVRVVAGGKESVANIARFASAPDPDLARPGIEVTMGRDKKAIVRRVRRNAAEPTLPWLLNAPHPVRPSETLTYVGTLEESQRNKYVLLVPEDGAFRMIPCEEWYSFVPRPAPIAAMKRADHERSQADAERRMRARYDGSDSYLERKAVCRRALRANSRPSPPALGSLTRFCLRAPSLFHLGTLCAVACRMSGHGEGRSQCGRGRRLR